MTAAASECDGTMVIRMAPWTFAVALTLLTVAPVGGEDVTPPRLTCVQEGGQARERSSCARRSGAGGLAAERELLTGPG